MQRLLCLQHLWRKVRGWESLRCELAEMPPMPCRRDRKGNLFGVFGISVVECFSVVTIEESHAKSAPTLQRLPRLSRLQPDVESECLWKGGAQMREMSNIGGGKTKKGSHEASEAAEAKNLMAMYMWKAAPFRRMPADAHKSGRATVARQECWSDGGGLGVPRKAYFEEKLEAMRRRLDIEVLCVALCACRHCTFLC